MRLPSISIIILFFSAKLINQVLWPAQFEFVPNATKTSSGD